ncbi:MAG: FctA domain-containing protein [Eubacteriales bacterium]|nr:FctA domain-containing protein [Eubacteriales bacterium]
MKQKFNRCLLALVAILLALTGRAVPAAAADSCQFSLPISVSWTEKELPAQTKAVITMSTEQSDAPLPEQTELTVEAAEAKPIDGKAVKAAAFPAITYHTPADYIYLIRQQPSADKQMQYDDTEYQVTVRVYYDVAGKMTASIVAVNGKTGAKPQELLFENKYSKPETPPLPAPQPPAPQPEQPNRYVPPTRNPSTGEYDARPLWLLVMLASATVGRLIWGLRRREEVLR